MRISLLMPLYIFSYSASELQMCLINSVPFSRWRFFFVRGTFSL